MAIFTIHPSGTLVQTFTTMILLRNFPGGGVQKPLLASFLSLVVVIVASLNAPVEAWTAATIPKSSRMNACGNLSLRSSVGDACGLEYQGACRCFHLELYKNWFQNRTTVALEAFNSPIPLICYFCLSIQIMILQHQFFVLQPNGNLLYCRSRLVVRTIAALFARCTKPSSIKLDP